MNNVTSITILAFSFVSQG